MHLLHICRQIRHEALSLVCDSALRLTMRQAPSGPLTQEFDVSAFSFARLELISKLQLVTRYYAEW